MADGRFDGRHRTSDVRRQPQPWQVDAIENHGGAIGFPLAIVIFFQIPIGQIAYGHTRPYQAVGV